jgi:hypothetical protein
LLEQYTRDKTTKELEIDVTQKRSNELAKQAAWELHKSKEEKLERQIAACTLTAPIDGLVVYANDPTRSFGRNQPQIEEGATVRERQKIISIPDISRLQVNTKVDESRIDKIATNLKARIRVHAFADQVLNGRVLDVAPLADPSNFFSPDRKVYTTRVAVANRLPGLRPGMTAQVEILVADRDNVLGLPVQALLHYDGKDHVAVKTPDGRFEWREVTRGVSNDQFVEIQQGIQSGEIVALKPLTLMSEEEKRERFWDEADAPGTVPGSATKGRVPGVPGKSGEPAKAKAKAKGKAARGANLPSIQRFRRISPEDRARLKSASDEERIEILKNAGFTEEELQQREIFGRGQGRPGDKPPAKSDE